jgi:hypothetical protein
MAMSFERGWHRPTTPSEGMGAWERCRNVVCRESLQRINRMGSGRPGEIMLAACRHRDPVRPKGRTFYAKTRRPSGAGSSTSEPAFIYAQEKMMDNVQVRDAKGKGSDWPVFDYGYFIPRRRSPSALENLPGVSTRRQA